MAPARTQPELYHPSPRRPCCFSPFLVCPLGLASMSWNTVKEGPKCIPSLCLKYGMMCLANSLWATGWLLLSILSILSELLPSVVDTPPTYPRLPSRQNSRSSDDPPVRPSLNVISMQTGAGRLRDQEAEHESLPLHGAQRTQSNKSTDLHMHHVHFTGGDEDKPVPPTVGSPPRTPERRSVELPEDSALSPPVSSASSQQPSPPLSNGSNDVPVTQRGRKMAFIRRRFANMHRRSASFPVNALLTPPGSAATSPARSPERPESAFIQGSSTSPYRVKRKQRSADIVSPKHIPVPRTDPYQAPYFFPSPLSPEAPGYVFKVRSERLPSTSPKQKQSHLASEDSPSAQLPTPTSSPEHANHTDLSLDPKSPSAVSEPSSNGASTSKRSSKRRSWHIPFSRPSNSHQSISRPTSWGSDAPTIGSLTGESRLPDVAPSRPKLFWRRSANGQLAPLSPLHSTVAIDEVTRSTKEKRRSWRPFR